MEARDRLADIPNVTVHAIPTNDCWIRDYGPTFVVHPETGMLGAVLWQFNAWGNKYHPHDDDAAAAKRICHWMNSMGLNEESVRVFPSSLVVEGGGLETDGEGTLLATSSSILNPLAKSRLESSTGRRGAAAHVESSKSDLG